MKPGELASLGTGFTDVATGSQAVFRAALQALSHPGRPVELRHDAETPERTHAAAAALLLALLDPDCRLWLSPSLLAHSDAAAWLRFHCGCALVERIEEAQFAWIGTGDELPALGSFAQGSDAYPERSATCVIEVQGFARLTDAAGWILRGPGIDGHQPLWIEHASPSFGAEFRAAWSTNAAAFPRGVDIFFATPGQLVGLPRSTRIEPER